MSIIVNNNLSLADKEANVIVFDREHRVSIVEENCQLPGLTLTKFISYKDEEAGEGNNENEEEKNENEDFNYNYSFIPSVSCDNYDSVNVYGHSQM